MSTQLRNTIAGVTAGFLVLFLAMPVAAFQGFDDGGGGGLPSCAGCHGSLANSGPGNAVHDAHASPANACSDCHNGSFNNPPLDDCVQCHGRNADAGVDNASAGIGRGLRLHHSTTGAAACQNCHSDSVGTSNVGEHILPSFYALAFGGAGMDSCDGSEELYASSTPSRDNDGDGLTDGNDPDCIANTAPTANPNGPYNAVAGNVVVFSSDGSSDPDGTIVSYAWNFGDGSSGTGASPTHTYMSEGTFTVTLTVTDVNGNVSTATCNIAIQDNVNPIALCQDLTIQLDASGNAVLTAGQVDNGSSDACGIASLVIDDNTFACADVGANTVTLTVTDNNGNTDQCQSTVTIIDTISPTAVCQDIDVYLDAAGSATIVAADVERAVSNAR